MVEESRKTLHRAVWKVERYGTVDEVLMDDGSVRYHVRVQDAGRQPFLTRWFNEEDRALDFLEKVRINALSSL